jgi:hypothetical protein
MDQRRAEPVRFDDEAAAKVEAAELEAAWGCIISSMFAAFRANQVAATATAAANGRRQMAIISTGKKAVPREVCEEPFFDGGDLRGARAVGL